MAIHAVHWETESRSEAWGHVPSRTLQAAYFGAQVSLPISLAPKWSILPTAFLEVQQSNTVELLGERDTVDIPRAQSKRVLLPSMAESLSQ